MRNVAHMRNADYLTTSQVAERLGLNVATINRWVRVGRLTPAMQYPGQRGARLFHAADIDALAAEATS